LSQTWLTAQVAGGAKVAQGGPKYLQGGSCPPALLLSAPMKVAFLEGRLFSSQSEFFEYF